MLTLLPLSGLHSALKRRNSKSYDFSRRGSLSVYSTYSLPSSKSSMRRFSSYEELAPIFQIFGQDVQSKTKSLKRKGSGKGSGKGNAKQSAPSRDVEVSTCTCEELDAQIARIKGQLEKFKSEDAEISQRITSLSSSVEELCCAPISRRPLSSLSSSCESTESTLEVISESSNESADEGSLGSESDNEQTFEDYCRTSVPKLGASRPNAIPLRFSEVDFNYDVPLCDPKEHCILNNLVKPPRAKSTTQLDIIHNDLTMHDITSSQQLTTELDVVQNDFVKRDATFSQRLSTVSCNSDSILFVHRHHWPTPPTFQEPQ